MVYYTQFIFIKEGREAIFQQFEDNVLPFLKDHSGELLYRVRPSDSSVVQSAFGYPYEIHLVTFPDKENFTAYKDDERRMQYITLLEGAVEKVLLLEGQLL